MQFLVDDECSEGKEISLRGPDALHIRKSLRKKKGDTLLIRDINGSIFYGRISNIGSDAISCVILKHVKSPEPGFGRLILVQSVISNKCMELVIQKAVEMGVDAIAPVLAQHSNIRPSSEVESARKRRWERIAYEAYKQSERYQLPEIFEPVGLSEFLKGLSGDVFLLWLDKSGGNKLPDLPAEADIYMIAGPEGGFSKGELVSLEEKGRAGLCLGESTLRAETASIAGLAVINYLRR